MPKSVPKFIVFPSVDFVGIWCVSGYKFMMLFAVVRGLKRLAATDRENIGNVKFVDSIEKPIDFQEN